VESRTKRRLDPGELERVVSVAFGPRAGLATVRELTDGWFNAAYAIELDDGRKAMVKVAPPPHLRLLTYETDLMRAEIEFLTRAAAAGVRVPRVLYSDLSRTLLESDYLVLEWLEGVPLDTLELDEDERRGRASTDRRARREAPRCRCGEVRVPAPGQRDAAADLARLVPGDGRRRAR
jgi:aminoglycoside phosphotransferase (APT) family kinase protein